MSDSSVTGTPELPEVFRGSWARRTGLLTAGELRGPKVRRLFQDAYARADVVVTHELRCRAAALIVPRQAVLTGRSAATVRGVDLAKPYDPVEFVVPEKYRFGPIDGIHVRRTAVGRRQSRHWQGIRIARPARIALDLVLRLSPRKRSWARRLRQGVPDLDAFLRAVHVPLRTLVAMFFCRRNRGIRLAREALQMVDLRAESRPESETRVILDLADYDPTPQHPVPVGRRHYRLDLALKRYKIGIEYDGIWHNAPEQQQRDRERRAAIIAEGWAVITLTRDHLAGDHRHILELVQQAIDARATTRA
ncbi:endonuclease domain-containing protein [Amycolatopsis sp. CA-230715]|uniref:endonuclease domain-containing protein n=1 Tax=Amycolatopsis sp. CA-230715 TaxID=2745196 RepID=UPI001C01215F|nr:hypothetical protein HUW46_03044 [Amycolatopsis sp. CA-230715]